MTAQLRERRGMMHDMGGRHAVWLLLLPLAGIGWLTAHWLACMLVARNGHDTPQHHADAGHGYLVIAAPVLIACAGTLLLAGIALAIGDGLRGRARSHLPGWRVALLPPLGFAVQEHVEWLIATDASPFAAALQPTFLVGMALQLPIAVGALLAARAVLAFGHVLGRALAAPRSPRAPARPIALNPLDRLEPELVRPPILATGRSERGPPLSAAA
jgi:hypothetical protein